MSVFLEFLFWYAAGFVGTALIVAYPLCKYMQCVHSYTEGYTDAVYEVGARTGTGLVGKFYSKGYREGKR